MGCNGMVNVNIPDSVTEIAEFAFAKCSNLESVTLPKYLTTLMEGAFWNCIKINNIQIPKTLKYTYVYSFDNGPFEGCSNLKNIMFEQGVEVIVKSLF